MRAGLHRHVVAELPQEPAAQRLRAILADAGRRADFVLAVSEAAACALAYGPCAARLRLWTVGTRALGEIYADETLLRQGPPGVRQDGAETLRRWLLRQLCDDVSVEPGPHGVTVRFSVMLT